MSYGCGNYMCRGDPGFFGFIGNALKTVARIGVGTAVGAITGGGVKGAIAGAIGATVKTTAHNIGQATLQAGDSSTALTPALRAAHAAALARGPVHAAALSSAAMDGYGRRRRRMNWANPRALGRAERRIHSAVKHFSKYIRWVHPGRAGHAAPKFRRRKKAA